MTLLTEWSRLKAQLDQQDGQVLQRLIDAYGITYMRVNPQIDALIEHMTAQLDAGTLTKQSVSKSSAYKQLTASIEHEISDYSVWVKTEVSTEAIKSAKQGLSAGKFLLLVSLADALGVSVKDVPKDIVANAPPDALSFLADYLDPRGVLFGKIEYLAGYHSTAIADGILERVSEGMNPKEIATWITDAYGVPLTDSMRMTRTVQLYSYRQSTASMQSENADLLEGGVWCAEMDDLTCMSCIALNGQVFPAGTVCDDHHNGRCDIIPWVKGMPNPIAQNGEDWFKQQPEATQASMMGQSKYDAWKEGKFSFDQLSTVHDDPVFGSMRNEASLQSILGD